MSIFLEYLIQHPNTRTQKGKKKNLDKIYTVLSVLYPKGALERQFLMKILQTSRKISCPNYFNQFKAGKRQLINVTQFIKRT